MIPPHISLNDSRDRLDSALATISPSSPLLVGPGWIAIATPEDLEPLAHDQRVIPLTHGVYGMVKNRPTRVRDTLAALMVFDVLRFADALITWDSKVPS